MITCYCTIGVQYATGLLTEEEGTLNCIILWVGRVEKTLKTGATGLRFVQDVIVQFMIGSQNMENYQRVPFLWQKLRKTVRLIWKS